MKNLLFLLPLLATFCTKQDDCKPLRCKVTQYDYQICLVDGRHQLVYDAPETFYIDTDECTLELELKPMFAQNDTLGMYRYPHLQPKPTECDCYE